MAWDQIVPLAVFLSLIVVLMLFMRRRLDRENRRPGIARALCAELEFDFIAGLEARYRNQGPGAVLMDPAGLDRLPSSLKSSLMEDSSWRGEGSYRGVRVAVYDDIRPTGSHFQTFFVVRAWFPERFKEPFTLEMKGAFSFLSPGRLQTGNGFFDRKLRLRGGKEGRAVQSLLSDRFMRAAEALFRFSGRASINEEGVCWEKREAPMEMDLLKKALDLVTDTVRAVSPVSG